MKKFEDYKMRSHSVCKICEEKIPKGEECIRLPDVHVSPKRKDLFFHIKCFGISISDVVLSRVL